MLSTQYFINYFFTELLPEEQDKVVEFAANILYAQGLDIDGLSEEDHKAIEEGIAESKAGLCTPGEEFFKEILGDYNPTPEEREASRQESRYIEAHYPISVNILWQGLDEDKPLTPSEQSCILQMIERTDAENQAFIAAYEATHLGSSGRDI